MCVYWTEEGLKVVLVKHTREWNAAVRCVFAKLHCLPVVACIEVHPHSKLILAPASELIRAVWIEIKFWPALSESGARRVQWTRHFDAIKIIFWLFSLYTWVSERMALFCALTPPASEASKAERALCGNDNLERERVTLHFPLHTRLSTAESSWKHLNLLNRLKMHQTLVTRIREFNEKCNTHGLFKRKVIISERTHLEWSVSASVENVKLKPKYNVDDENLFWILLTKRCILRVNSTFKMSKVKDL